MSTVNASLALEAIDRMIEAHVHRTHPFHDPIASDAGLAAREIKAELRRLHASEAVLLKAMSSIASEFPPGDARKVYDSPMEALDRIRSISRSAIAKAKEANNV